jgi:hypothetical protein
MSGKSEPSLKGTEPVRDLNGSGADWSAEAEETGTSTGKQMNVLKVSKLLIIAVSCVGLAGAARGQGRGGGGGAHAFGPMNNPGLSHMSDQGLTHSSFGRENAQNHISQNGQDDNTTTRADRKRDRRAQMRKLKRELRERHDQLEQRAEQNGTTSVKFQEMAQELKDRRAEANQQKQELKERHQDATSQP